MKCDTAFAPVDAYQTSLVEIHFNTQIKGY